MVKEKGKKRLTVRQMQSKLIEQYSQVYETLGLTAQNIKVTSELIYKCLTKIDLISTKFDESLDSIKQIAFYIEESKKDTRPTYQKTQDLTKRHYIPQGVRSNRLHSSSNQQFTQQRQTTQKQTQTKVLEGWITSKNKPHIVYKNIKDCTFEDIDLSKTKGSGYWQFETDRYGLTIYKNLKQTGEWGN